MALLDKLKKKSDETSVGTEVIDLYKEIISLEEKILKKYNYINYFQNYCNELIKIKTGKDNKDYTTNYWFRKETGFDIPKKYDELFISLTIENVILKKFEDKLSDFYIGNEDQNGANWWCPNITTNHGLNGGKGKKIILAKADYNPQFKLIESSDKKNAIKEIKKFCNSSKKILLANNYKLTFIINGEWWAWTEEQKSETLYKTKKTDIKNYKKEIDSFFELFTKKYLNIKI